MGRRKVIIAGLILSMGLLMALYYARQTYPSCLESCAAYHQAIIAGTADSPHRYRVLAPFAVQAAFAPTSAGSIGVAYVTAHMITLPTMLLMMFVWFKRWVGGSAALVGVLFVAAYSPIMFGVGAYGISLYTPVEVIFLIAGLMWLTSGRGGVVFGVIVALATLNRETAILLVIAYGVLRVFVSPSSRKDASPPTSKDALVPTPETTPHPQPAKTPHPQPLSQKQERGDKKLLAIYAVVWAVIFVGVRVWRGAAPDQVTAAAIFAANFGGGWVTTEAMINHGVLIPLWLLAIVGLRQSTPTMKKIALIGVPYVALLGVFAMWNETRLLLPLMVVWMPLALRAIENQRD